MGETGLPGFDEGNYALKSAAGVNSLPSQLALFARILSLCLPQHHTQRQGLQTCTHAVHSQQTRHRYMPTALQPQHSLLKAVLERFMQTTIKRDEYVETKGCSHTYVQQAHINTMHLYTHAF